jgi:hypothetical protein
VHGKIFFAGRKEKVSSLAESVLRLQKLCVYVAKKCPHLTALFRITEMCKIIIEKV